MGEKGKNRGEIGKMATLSAPQTTPLGSLRSLFSPFPPNAELGPRLKVTLQYGIHMAYTKTIIFLTVEYMTFLLLLRLRGWEGVLGRYLGRGEPLRV